MPNIVEYVNTISKTVGDMLDFIANDEYLARDFEEYLEVNNIEISGEKQFNNVIMEYLLDMKTQSGLRVLEYFRRHNKNSDDVVDALLNSTVSVFKIEKISQTSYDVECLTSGAHFALFPLVKMTHLKHIGRYDYITARVIELAGIDYVLEIYDIISEFNPFDAYRCAIKTLISNPKSAHYKNPAQKTKLDLSRDEFREKFASYFNAQYISTTNKKADKLIENFGIYRESGEKLPYADLIEAPPEYRFLNIEEFDAPEASFLLNASSGFSSHKETYDVALWMDNKRGLYIIPFLETFSKCFTENIENKDTCIVDFLINDKIPPSVIKWAKDNHENFFEVVNKALKTDFQTLDELLFQTKSAFADEGIYSPVTAIYNSSLLEKISGLKKEDNPPLNVGRNEPCPCGSGLKYKNCCGKN